MELSQYLQDNINYDPKTGDLTYKVRGKGRDISKPIRNLKSNGYYQLYLNPINFRVSNHRLAWFLYYGVWPENQIDHINGNRADNKITNLRDVTASVNQRNRRDLTEDSGVRFRKDRKRWQAYITIDDRFVNLGHFGCKTAAKLKRFLKERDLGYVRAESSTLPI